MLRRVATIVLLLAAFAAPAHAAAPPELMPGVTYQKIVQFTPHGAVVLHVITAPKPDPAGLYQLTPVLGRGTVMGGRERVTQIEKDVSSQATVVGINGDLFNWTDGHPSGIFMSGGVLAACAAFDALVDRYRLDRGPARRPCQVLRHVARHRPAPAAERLQRAPEAGPSDPLHAGVRAEDARRPRRR